MTASPLRIAYLATRPIPSRETDTQQVVSTVDALGGAGVEVELVVPGSWRQRGSAAAFEAAVRAFYDVHRPFRIRRRWTVEPSALQLERPLHALLAVLRQDRDIDLVHTRSRGVVTLCTALRIPVVFETYRRLGQTAPRFAALLARLSRSPWLLGIVTHSHASADSLVGAGVARDRIAVLHNGHDPRKLEPRLDRDAARAQLGIAPAARIALYTGNVQANKGLDTLLELAARVPEVTVLIVGGKDRDVEALREEVRRRGLTNVECPGWRPAAELAPYFHAADVLLIPPTGKPLLEHGQTVLPMKVFPYLAAGRPILAPALPDIGEVLHHDVNAWLVPPDDAAAAAEGLRRLLGDPALAARLAAAALETSAGLTWDARAAALVARYREWLAALDRARPGRRQRAPV